MVFLHAPAISQNMKQNIPGEVSEPQGGNTLIFQDKEAKCLMQEWFHLLEWS